jgi:hypothetical protein
MSNDSGMVTLPSDTSSLLELQSQKSSLSEAIIIMELEEDEGCATDPFAPCSESQRNSVEL